MAKDSISDNQNTGFLKILKLNYSSLNQGTFIKTSLSLTLSTTRFLHPPPFSTFPTRRNGESEGLPKASADSRERRSPPQRPRRRGQGRRRGLAARGRAPGAGGGVPGPSRPPSQDTARRSRGRRSCISRGLGAGSPPQILPAPNCCGNRAASPAGSLARGPLSAAWPSCKSSARSLRRLAGSGQRPGSRTSAGLAQCADGEERARRGGAHPRAEAGAPPGAPHERGRRHSGQKGCRLLANPFRAT